jgi:hypothetical protein
MSDDDEIERIANGALAKLQQDDRYSKLLKHKYGHNEATLLAKLKELQYQVAAYDVGKEKRIDFLVDTFLWFAESLTSQPISKAFVYSVSSVAKEIDAEGGGTKYRDRVLKTDYVRGGFIAHPIFVEFTKAARRMRVEGNGPHDEDCDEEWNLKKNQLEKRAVLLSRRKEKSLFQNEYYDAELPQSVLASELLREALVIVAGNSNHNIFTTHQFPIVASMDDNENDHLEIRPNKKKKTDSDQSSSSTRKKLDFQVDVMSWFEHENSDIGACALAPLEYKPTNTKEEERKNQADMSATNIHYLNEWPCISADIEGGRKWTEWKISASAIFGSLDEDGPLLEKSCMLDATGVDGLLCYAAGLLAAKQYFPKVREGIELWKRLGPVVGHDGKEGTKRKVFKAYDGASYRRHNIDLIREFIDKDAILWISHDDTLSMVEMQYFHSNWKKPVKVSVFKKILRDLLTLHNKYGAHGDIRLANLLSTGQIIDFDFVGNGTYPPGLQLIQRDGKRHDEVEDASNKGTLDKLEIKKEHDWFSMAYVMNLFNAAADNEKWIAAAMHTKEGDVDSAMSALNDLGEHVDVELQDNTIQLMGTGVTPQKPN